MSKELLEQLALAKRREVDIALDQYPRLKYAMLYHQNIRGQPMDFHDKPYLTQIYMDEAPEIVMQSSVQTGKTEMLIVSAHSYSERGLQVLYTLPTDKIRNEFVANRIDKLYKNVPRYREMVDKGAGVSDARGLKHFGKGAIFFGGSGSSTTFIEKPIDLVIGDEVDRFDLDNYAMADDRMTASPWKLKYEASNPTVEKFGIHKRMTLSDQRSFFIKCPCCNYWQSPDFFKNVVRQVDSGNYILLDDEWNDECVRDIHMMCARCGGVLDRFSTSGQWVPKYPKFKDTHGYHIHQLLSSFVKVTKLWARFNLALNDDTAMQVFYNSDLGLPFAGKGSKLTNEILNKCKREYLFPLKAPRCVMGVDVGKRLNVVIFEILPNERLRTVFAGTVREFEELDYLRTRFDVITYVLDAMPETRKSLEYAKKVPGRGWACRYINGLVEVKTNDEERMVTVDRTMIMDRVQKFFMDQRYELPANAQTVDKGNLYDQLMTPTRIYNEDKGRFEWLGDPDHYFHAFVYATLAYIIRGDFGVVGVNIALPHAVASNQKNATPEFDESMFPPNTPEQIKAHYRALYANAKGQKNE